MKLCRANSVLRYNRGNLELHCIDSKQAYVGDISAKMQNIMGYSLCSLGWIQVIPATPVCMDAFSMKNNDIKVQDSL